MSEKISLDSSVFRHQIFMILTDFIEKISKIHRGT